MKFIKKLLVLAGFAVFALPVFAQTIATGNFQATASLNGTCNLQVDDIAFGTMIPYPNLPMAYQSSNGYVNVTCSNELPYTVTFTDGQIVDGYEYYAYYGDMTGATAGNTDTIRLLLVLHGGGSTQSIVSAGTGVLQSFFMEANATSLSLVTPDNYSKIVTALIEY